MASSGNHDTGSAGEEGGRKVLGSARWMLLGFNPFYSEKRELRGEAMIFVVP
jgi:hypothetical protein